MMFDIKAGCVRFDSASQVTGGWASIDGQPPFRFDNISDLDSECVFLTNMGFNEAHKTGLSNSSKIRTTNYFDTAFYSISDREENLRIQNQEILRLKKSPNDMISQVGIDDEDWEKQTQICSKIANRVFNHAEISFDIKRPPFFELKRGIHDAILSFDRVIKNTRLFDALETSTTHFSLVQRPIDAIQLDVDYGISVSLNKVRHTLDIMSQPLPDFNTEWLFTSKKIPLNKSKAYIESLNNHGIYLLKVNFKSFSQDYASVINFGTGVERRAWITGAEALFYKDISTFEILQVFEAKKIIEEAPIYKEMASLYSPDTHSFSYSAGLFLQNIWTGLAKSKPAPANIKKQYESYNIFMPFLKAYDRLILIETAKKLTDLGVVVTSYSKAELRIILRDTQLNQDSFSIFEKANVNPHGLKIDLSGFEFKSTPENLLRKIYMESSTDSLMLLDDKFHEQNKLEEDV